MEKIIVLYPGSFKPLHGGHLELIQWYNDNPSVEYIRVLVGPGIRDNIDQKIAVKIAEKLINLPKVFIDSVEWSSPVLAAYKILENSRYGVYALAASSKEIENSNRIDNFIFKHSKEGKFYKENISVINLPVDISPLNFKGRNDENEGKPISSSVLRQDLAKADINNFITGYPNCSEKKIKEVYEILLKNLINSIKWIFLTLY